MENFRYSSIKVQLHYPIQGSTVAVKVNSHLRLVTHGETSFLVFDLKVAKFSYETEKQVKIDEIDTVAGFGCFCDFGLKLVPFGLTTFSAKI